MVASGIGVKVLVEVGEIVVVGLGKIVPVGVGVIVEVGVGIGVALFFVISIGEDSYPLFPALSIAWSP